MQELQVEYLKIDDITPYENNPRHNDEAVDYVANSINEFGFKIPIVIDENNIIIAGHTRLKASKKLGLEKVPCIRATDLTEEQVKAFRVADNKVGEVATWDLDKLSVELEDIDMDMTDFGFSEIEIGDLELDNSVIVDDTLPEPPKEPKAKRGDIYKLGKHILMCGDSTKKEDVDKLTNGVKVDMVFTDPPYGMKKEKDGVINDNLNHNKLLEFNKKWIPLSFEQMVDNGSWYCWGIDEPLMDIYSNILKPMINKKLLTFRNLITWDKGNGQGQLSENFRMYPIADEKCLFVMTGVQGFNNNSDNYFEKWEPIRQYLKGEVQKCGWDIPMMKTIAGHSDKSRDHWTSKSQWSLVPEYVYIKFQKWAKEHGIDAFKKEYDEIKKEYYSTRAYFDNTHDNMNNVWHFERTNNKERELTGEHATPKPIALCERAIKSSSRKGETVLDLFGGSGTTLIACEQTNRNCYMMEYDPRYVDVIIERWEELTGGKAEKI